MLTIDHIVPTYFDEQKFQYSEIWNQEVKFGSHSFIEIIAPSGSGKTSLIHFLYGMRKNYSGEIKLHQTSITNANVDEISIIRRDNMSVVFQDLRLFPQLTIEDNLMLQHNVSPNYSIAEIKELLNRLGVVNKWNQKASLCSYGEQQRIAIARALSKPFEFLLLDEPFSHLDDLNSILALELIQEEVKKRNATMLLADLNKNQSFQPDKIYHL